MAAGLRTDSSGTRGAAERLLDAAFIQMREKPSLLLLLSRFSRV